MSHIKLCDIDRIDCRNYLLSEVDKNREHKFRIRGKMGSEGDLFEGGECSDRIVEAEQ